MIYVYSTRVYSGCEVGENGVVQLEVSYVDITSSGILKMRSNRWKCLPLQQIVDLVVLLRQST